MEITAQIAALEAELNLVKGEIKSILEEIRAAVLDRDNPFSSQGSLPVFRRVAASEPAADPTSDSQEGTAAGPTDGAAADGREDPAGHMEPPAPTVPTTPPGPPLPAMTGGQASGAPTQTLPPQAGATSAEAGCGPALPPPMPDEAALQPWTVPTIASLVAWIDESSERLGAAHLHMILDLARFAGLLPSEAQDVLQKVIKLATGRKDSSSPSVNDILLALRQLEAILAGEEADELALVRRRRVAGGNR